MSVADFHGGRGSASLAAAVLILVLAGLARADGAAEPAAVEGAEVHHWRRQASENFELWAHGTAAELSELSAALEAQLTQLHEAWSIDRSGPRWQPRCQVFVHVTREAYIAAAGPGSERTNGSSLVHFDRGQVVGRRIDLDGARSDWQTETMPHELTHVVLADEFPHGRLPRWADEGAAMLADSPHKRARHRQDAHSARKRGAELPVAQLLNIEQPLAAGRMAAFYGQSLTLVEHLVAQGDRRRFLDFLHEADRAGYDASLRAYYGLASPARLAAAFEPSETHRGPQLTGFTGQTPTSVLRTQRASRAVAVPH